MIHKKNLQPGDILLFRITPRSSWCEKFIAWAQNVIYKVPQKAKFCHISLVDYDTNFMLEAVWPKTRISKIDFSNIQPEKIEVYRVRKITDEQIKKTLDWAHDHLGEWYDIPLFITGWIDAKHAEVCSTFVSHAFRNAGLDIPYSCEDKKLILPDDFYLDTIGVDRIM